MWTITKMLMQPARRAPQYLPTSPQITPDAPEAFGGAGARALQGAVWSSVAWPSANLVVMFPFTILRTTDFKALFVENGGTAAGNWCVSVLDDGGGTATINRLATTGSVAQSGTSVPQISSVSFTLGEGDYYCALCCDSTSATFQAKAPAVAGIPGIMGAYEVADNGSAVIGATLTAADFVRTYFPRFGLSQVVTF